MLTPLPDVTPAWTEEVRQEELDLPRREREGERAEPYHRPFDARLQAMAVESVKMGRHAALMWVDVTEHMFETWGDSGTALGNVRLNVMGQGIDEKCVLTSYFNGNTDPFSNDRTPSITVRYPQVTLTDVQGQDCTVLDDYIDAFEPLAPVWNDVIFHEFVQAMTRIGRAFPEGMGASDLLMARRLALGEAVAVHLEGDRLRDVAQTVPLVASDVAAKPRTRL